MPSDKEMNVQLGRFIKKEREELGVTVAQLAENISENSDSVRRYESGHSPISRYQLARILRSLERLEIAQFPVDFKEDGETR